jgi:hypothetical protein
VPAWPELQRRFAAALRDGPQADALADCIVSGAIPLAARLGVHRNTVRGGLCQALRLRHPTVARLLGEDRFDQVALAYAGTDWPREPQLDAWGAGFAGFLAGHAPVAAQPWLPELARFDALLDALSALADDGPAARWPWYALSAEVEFALAPSLRLFTTGYPVDELRAAVATADAPGPQCCTPAAQPLNLVAWRNGSTLKTRRLGVGARQFLAALLDAAPPAAALAAAIDASGTMTATDVIAALQREVLAAPFAALRLQPGTQPPTSGSTHETSHRPARSHPL